MLTIVRSDNDVRYIMRRVKTCNVCNDPKSIDDFSLSKSGNLRLFCDSCRNKNARNNRKKNPDRSKEVRRKSSLKRKYGISLDDYNLLFEKQEGKCAICGKSREELTIELSIDHDHKTGRIRGLLCSDCNLGIGLFKDNPDLFNKVLTYLNQ